MKGYLDGVTLFAKTREDGALMLDDIPLYEFWALVREIINSAPRCWECKFHEESEAGVKCNAQNPNVVHIARGFPHNFNPVEVGICQTFVPKEDEQFIYEFRAPPSRKNNQL